MKLFYYVHTGHRIGLDRFRRAATIIRALGDVEITLLTSDFRIASVAREYGVKRSVGVDVVRNIPQIAHHGDMMIFDSAEANPAILADMRRFFSRFVRVSDAPDEVCAEGEYLISPYLEGERVFTGSVVEGGCFEPTEKTIERAFFFGDDDYEEELLKHGPVFEGLGLELLLGFYWFLGYEKKLETLFPVQHECESYDDVVRRTKQLVTSSPQAALENLACGGRPVYLQRPDYPRDFLPLFETLGIPVVDGYDRVLLTQAMENSLSKNYQILSNNTDKLVEFLKATLDLSNIKAL